jgi:hypothetical protein
MIEKRSEVGTAARRAVTAALAVVVGVITIAGAFHDHELLFVARAGLALPSTAVPSLQHHDCLACKIAPPLATPSIASKILDPGLVASPRHPTREALPLHEAPRLTVPPRAPPAPSLV